MTDRFINILYTRVYLTVLISNLTMTCQVQRNESQRVETYSRTCSPNEDSNPLAHPRFLISNFVAHVKKLCILGYPIYCPAKIQMSLRIAQADLTLRLALFRRCVSLTLRFTLKGFSCLIICHNFAQVKHDTTNQ